MFWVSLRLVLVHATGFVEKYQNIFYTLLSGGVYLDENRAVPVCSLAAFFVEIYPLLSLFSWKSIKWLKIEYWLTASVKITPREIQVEGLKMEIIEKYTPGS